MMFAASLLSLAATFAQTATPTQDSAPTEAVRVGVFVEPPFVTKDAKGVYKGYSYELWEQIESKLERQSAVTEFTTFASLLDATQRGEVDIAVCDSFITSARLARMEFTCSIADGGLRVMVNTVPKHSFARLFTALKDRGHLAVFGYGALCIVVLSVFLMLFWKRIDKDFPEASHDAFAEALFRTTTLTMSGKTKVSSTSTWYTKILAAIWLVFGISTVAYVTSTVTSVMTAQSMQHDVGRVDDLADKTVAVVKGTTGEDYCLKRGFGVLTFPSLGEAVDAMMALQADAVVSDGLLLEAYDQSHPALNITVTGPVFEKRDYGFALPRNSPLRHEVNVALLQLEEAGDIAALYAKYFGNT